MAYLKYVSFLYLVAAAFFIYDGIIAYTEGRNGILMLGLAAMAVFMFFFRRHFQKKMEQEKRNK